MEQNADVMFEHSHWGMMANRTIKCPKMWRHKLKAVINLFLTLSKTEAIIYVCVYIYIYTYIQSDVFCIIVAVNSDDLPQPL